MKTAPPILDGARVIQYAPIDERCRHTESCRHSVAGNLIGPAAALAICQYEGQQGYYLFYCDSGGRVVTDTWHETIEDAERQAEFEYEGVSNCWLAREQVRNE